jgi:predicted TPR repeat methyltransferase
VAGAAAVRGVSEAMSERDTTSEAFFEAKYRESADPWKFATSEYEQRRYDAILRAIAGRRFEHALEPGCSIGVLTEKLAAVCDTVDAMDISATAVAKAKERTADLGNVRTTCGAFQDLLPAGDFDLVVFSEIGYYFTEAALREVAATLVGRLRTSGLFLAAHWTGESRDHILSGDAVHETLSGFPELCLQHSERHAGFRLDVWRREPLAHLRADTCTE